MSNLIKIKDQALYYFKERALFNLFDKASGLWKGGSEEQRYRKSHQSKNE